MEIRRHFTGAAQFTQDRYCPPEIRLIQKVVIKERGAEVFIKKSASPPSCESPSKLQRHPSLKVLGN